MSSHVLWMVCGRLPLQGYRGPGPVRAPVNLSGVLLEAGVAPAVHLHRPAPLATPSSQCVKCLAGTYAAYQVQQRLRYLRGWWFASLGAAVQRRPRK